MKTKNLGLVQILLQKVNQYFKICIILITQKARLYSECQSLSSNIALIN